MPMYVIKNTEHGGFVAPSGARSSYVQALQFARTWPSKEEAEKEQCRGNEQIMTVEEAMWGMR